MAEKFITLPEEGGLSIPLKLFPSLAGKSQGTSVTMKVKGVVSRGFHMMENEKEELKTIRINIREISIVGNESSDKEEGDK